MVPATCRLTVWVCACVAASAGCNSGGPNVVAVTGVVTRGGKPVSNLFLTFEPERGRPSWGITDESGRFTLQYDRRQDGAVVGKHKVYVDFKPRDPGEEAALRGGRASPPKELKDILQKYGKAETTPLVVDIERRGQEVVLKLD